MSNQFLNFNYDPSKDGFDSSEWRKVYGDVAVVGGALRFTKAFIMHYGDILRGDVIFNINIAAPMADGNTSFGFIQYSKGVHAFFKIEGPVLTAETSDGITTKSIVIDWDSSWTDADTEFRIKWEAGLVTFYIGKQFKTSIGYSAVTDVISSVVPNDPMSLFVSSDSTDLFLLNQITVGSIQSFLMSTGNDNSIFEPFITESDRVSISEAITIFWKNYIAGNGIISENVAISESNTMLMKILVANEGIIPDSVRISDVISVSSPA